MFKFIPLKEKDNSWFTSQRMQHLYSSSDWLKCICDTYNFEVLLLIDESDNYHSAFCKLNDVLGKRLISLPFSDYLPFADLKPTYYEEIFKFCQICYPDYNITLKTKMPHGANILQNLVRKAVYHKITLYETASNFHKSFLRGVKKAQKLKVSVRIQNTENALRLFYELYHQLRVQKFNSIPQPFQFFEEIFKNFILKNNGFILEAIYKNKVIASMIILEHGDTAYYKFGCSHLDYLEYKPNNLLFFELKKILIERQFKYLDLGLSGCGDNYSGLRRWKDHLGGIMYHITYWHKETALSSQQKQIINKKKIDIQQQTQEIISSQLNAWETSKRSEKLYPYFA